VTLSILLTGVTGFVGRQVLRALVQRNCKIRAVVCKERGRAPAYFDLMEATKASAIHFQRYSSQNEGLTGWAESLDKFRVCAISTQQYLETK